MWFWVNKNCLSADHYRPHIRQVFGEDFIFLNPAKKSHSHFEWFFPRRCPYGYSGATFKGQRIPLIGSWLFTEVIFQPPFAALNFDSYLSAVSGKCNPAPKQWHQWNHFLLTTTNRFLSTILIGYRSLSTATQSSELSPPHDSLCTILQISLPPVLTSTDTVRALTS